MELTLFLLSPLWQQYPTHTSSSFSFHYFIHVIGVTSKSEGQRHCSRQIQSFTKFKIHLGKWEKWSFEQKKHFNRLTHFRIPVAGRRRWNPIRLNHSCRKSFSQTIFDLTPYQSEVKPSPSSWPAIVYQSVKSWIIPCCRGCTTNRLSRLKPINRLN